MKYEIYIYLQEQGFWFKRITTVSKKLAELQKEKFILQGFKIKESINYIGVPNA
jgi:hypothetical protein